MTCICPNCGHELPPTFKELKPQKIRLRSQCLPALKLLVESNRGFTAKELSRFFDDKMAQDIEDHFTELRFWRLIRKDGEKCYAEERGKLWVAGHFAISECGYTINGVHVDPPQDAPPISSVMFADLCPPLPESEEREQAVIQSSLLPA